MPSAPMKIRCYSCGQLLGVSRSKAGRVIACPKCASELTIPPLDALELVETGKPSPINEPSDDMEEFGLPEKFPEEAPADFEPAGAATAEAVEPAAEIKIPAIRVESTSKIRGSSNSVKVGATNRDLLIPRSVVAAWSLLVLAALMFAFLTGLLAGHFIWREH